MSRIYQYLTSINPDIYQAVLLAICFSLEQIFSNVQSLTRRSPHLFHNIILNLGYMLVNYSLAFLVIKCMDWAQSNEIGLFNILTFPFFLKVIMGFFLIDMVNYWAHRLYHTLAFFWRFHRVHHSDTFMDSATAYRFHPIDAIFDNAASLATVIVFGIDPSILIIWLVFYLPLLVLNHSRFIMPKWFDKTFGLIIASPNFHKVHHHKSQEYTDSNYGLFFIIWDRMFGTFKRLPVNEIEYGLAEFDEAKRQKSWFLLRSPFINIKK